MLVGLQVYDVNILENENNRVKALLLHLLFPKSMPLSLTMSPNYFCYRRKYKLAVNGNYVKHANLSQTWHNIYITYIFQC